MGGTRSGRWRDHHARPVAEATPRLHLDGVLRQRLKQILALGPGSPPRALSVSLQGWEGSACTITIVYNPAGAPQMRLAYRHENEPRSQIVALDRVPAHLGGHRLFWGCPVCERRCGVLYFLNAAWCCRRCGKLTYQSCNTSDTRVRQLLARPDLGAALGELLDSTDIGKLALAQKTLELIVRRTRREARQRYGRRGPPRSASAPTGARRARMPARPTRPSKP